MRGLISSVLTVFVLSVVAVLLWRHRTRNLAYVPARLESYWDTLKERRKFRRFKKKLAVDCSISESPGDRYHSFSKDISGEGICLQVPEIMPEGRQLNLEIHIPDKRTILVKGEIVWINEVKRLSQDSDRLFSAGIKFLKLNPKDKDLLAEFFDNNAEMDNLHRNDKEV